MAWLDDRIRDHPKIVRASAPAFKAWALALCYCSAHGTRGRLDEAVKALAIPPKIRAELVRLRLWDQDEDGLWVHDWQEHNSKRDEADEERRTQARERQRRHRERLRQAESPADQQRDDPVTSRVTSRDNVTRDEERDPRARPRDHDQEQDLRAAAAATTQDAVTDAAAATNHDDLEQRLAAIGLDAALPELEHASLPLIAQWLDIAEHEAERNPAGYVLAGVRSGRAPSSRVRTQDRPGEVDPVARRRRFVEVNGWRLPADELEFQLGEMGVEEGELVELLDLAADLRRGAAA